MGSQDGKRRRIHWAIAAPQVTPTFVNVVVVNLSFQVYICTRWISEAKASKLPMEVGVTPCSA